MTADFKCYPSPQQNTGVFILNGAMYAVIVCDIVLLFFTLSAQLLLFSCSDQRISISSLSSRLLLFHSSHFASSSRVHSYIVASTNMTLYLFFLLLLPSSFLTFNFLESRCPCIFCFLQHLQYFLPPCASLLHDHLCQSLLGLIAHQLLSGFWCGTLTSLNSI